MDEKDNIVKPTVFVLLAGLVFGCSACSQLSRNIYEGVQMQKRQEAPPNIDDRERTGQAPGYDEYLRQRRLVTETPAVSASPEAAPEIP
jgi:hypothetical protein